MLQIIHQKYSRIPNRVNIIFSDNSYLPLFVDDIIKLSLVKNQSIDSEKLDLIKLTSQRYLGREYALRQIALSPKTEKILSQKLKNYFFKIQKKFNLGQNQSIIDEIIFDLKSKNLLNPADFIAYFINKHKSKSRAQIIFLLTQQGIDINHIKFNIPRQNDVLSIQKILTRKKITKKDLSDFKTKSKILSSLYRRGFDSQDIQAAIDDYLNLK